jgi:Kef-type K+ transport system membrane component KefB
MPEITFDNLVIVSAVAFGVPLALGLAPKLRLPAIVLEIVVGIVIGPSGLGWVEVDAAVELMALIGLAFLLFVAGLEVEYDRLRGRLLGITGAAWLVSFGLALLAGYALDLGGLVSSPLLIAIAIAATGLGVVIPILKDADQLSTMFGRVVVAGCSIAEIATLVLVSLFFSGESAGVGSTLILLGFFGGLVLATAFALLFAEHSSRLSAALRRLQDTTAQIRIRGAFFLLALFVVIAEEFGLEVILGTFMAGAILKIVDRDQGMTHPEFRLKLEATAFGVFIPFFFVTSGIRFDLDALFASGETIARVPIFLAALLFVRGLPVVLYRSLVKSKTMLVSAALLQATSISFLVVVAEIGRELELLSEGSAAALIAAGLLSVVIFPITALTLLRREGKTRAVSQEPEPSAA